MCPSSHLGTLSNIHCFFIPDLWSMGGGVQHPGAMLEMSEAVRFGAQSGQGAEMPTCQQLLEQMSAHHDC